ncbi:MAG: CotH kinase family protein [Muribaculaceae bacterium]|nr:CotH kinase family protein [Muribaculaceae bacterium]
MKLRAIFSTILIATAAFGIAAQDPWLHVYSPNPSVFKQFSMDGVLDISFDEAGGTMTINTASDGPTVLSLGSIDRFAIGPNVCRIDIDTDMKVYDSTFGSYDGRPVTEIVSKTIYLEGTLHFDGRGIYEDVDAPVKIRGRGNSTWGYSKKPYRIKFTEKQKLGPVHRAKNLVLLANYLDGAMMRNFAAFAFGKLIEMPYINRSLPVDVYLNGIYKGSYHLTEKVGINNGSVDLPKEDEPNSILFELDTNSADEDEYPFNDSSFGVPVRIKDPDAPVDYYEREEWLDKWRGELNDFFGIVSGENPAEIFKVCNLETLVRYVMTFNIACNQELNHPKSVYLHKTDGGMWEFGPCWDFDWAYGYSPTYSKGQSSGSWWWNPVSYPTYENPLIGFGNGSNQGGNNFFYALCNNDVFLSRFKEVWDDFYNNKQEEFWRMFNEYAATLEPSAALQATERSQYQGWDQHVEELREWIQNRFDYINSDPNYGLWE